MFYLCLYSADLKILYIYVKLLCSCPWIILAVKNGDFEMAGYQLQFSKVEETKKKHPHTHTHKKQTKNT